MLESYLTVGVKCIYWVGLNLMKDFISCDKSFPLDHQIFRLKCRFNESFLSKYDITSVDIMEVTGNDFRILIRYRMTLLISFGSCITSIFIWIIVCNWWWIKHLDMLPKIFLAYLSFCRTQCCSLQISNTAIMTHCQIGRRNKKYNYLRSWSIFCH